MKTITFYSFKGGVGRTLALTNIANRLVEFGKEVCIMDFDLEAPGLDYKYSRSLREKTGIKQGLVDYIYDFSVNEIIHNIKDYVLSIHPNNNSKSIHFIPAGNIEAGEYWKKLSRINWWSLLYEGDMPGIDFFLNMKQQIQEELHPDYLLIDTRTGITEMSALTMSLLADRIVILAANNNENITGCCRVIEALSKEENNLLGEEKEIHFVLTRIPQPQTPDEKTQDKIIFEQKTNRIRQSIAKNGKALSSENIIHSDPELEKDEFYNMYPRWDGKSQSTSAAEYVKLFHSLTQKDFSEVEERKLKERKEVDRLLNIANLYISGKDQRFFDFVKQISKDYPSYPEPHVLLSRFYYEIDNWEKALEECDNAINKGDQTDEAYIRKATIYLFIKKYSDALKVLDQIKYTNSPNPQSLKIRINHCLNHNQEEAIKNISALIDAYPSYTGLHNERACYYRYYGQYDKALKDVYKALELDTELCEAYTTLAEIRYNLQEEGEFYRNLEMGLKYGYKMRDVVYDEDILSIYKAIVKEEKFRELLQKYNQDDAISLIENS